MAAIDLPRDQLEYAREAIAKELFYRRDRIANLFSWTSNLLVAITGFVVALATRNDTRPLSGAERGTLIFAVAVIAIYSFDWLSRNLAFKEAAAKAILELDCQLGVPTLGEPRHQFAGYRPTVVILALAATGAIWLF